MPADTREIFAWPSPCPRPTARGGPGSSGTSSSIGLLGGTVSISGLKPSTSYAVAWWDFNTKGTLSKRVSSQVTDGEGKLSLSLEGLPTIEGLPVTDTAVKIGY